MTKFRISFPKSLVPLLAAQSLSNAYLLYLLCVNTPLPLKSPLDTSRDEKDNPPSMTKYLYRTCPKCKDYLGVVVRDPPGPKSEISIDAYCVVCGFKLGWKVVLETAEVGMATTAIH